MHYRTFPLNWQVGHTSSSDTLPDQWIPAQVPGAVQLDWARSQNWPPVEYAGNTADYAWMEDAHWLYRAALAHEPLGPDERLFFVCDGVDYAFEVRLGGEVIHAQEGMFTPIAFDITAYAAPGDLLEILVLPAPKTRPSPADRVQANQSVKPAVSYGWDFHPRLIPLGIWGDARLEVRPACHIEAAEVFYDLDPDYKGADVELDLELSAAAPRHVRWQLLDRAGAVVLDQTIVVDDTLMVLEGRVERPDLWWPNGQGDPALYTSQVDLIDPAGQVQQRITARIGFRTIRLVMHETQWDEPEIQIFPKGRHTSPITLEVNGRRIFGKGANWVSPDIFPGRIGRDIYSQLLTLARDANFNLIRCWGGAIVQKEAFFDLCDELGLLIWQEFPLACNCYDGTPEYLDVLDQESRSIIERLRPHPSVALWCGGNELFNNWSRMTDQDLALRLLNRNCFDLDPNRPFLMTSPSMGMAHGGYFFRRPDGAEVHQYFAASHNTAYTEYGVTGTASPELLRQIIPSDQLWPPAPGTEWEARHAFKAWEPNSWLDLPILEDYFGQSNSLDELTERSQLLQAEGYKVIFEEARRQKPVCAMALNWCLNEPWPTAANNSVVSWPASPKPALAAIAASCRGVLASARIPKFRWSAGEMFTAQLWLLNDSPAAVAPGVVEAVLIAPSGREHVLARWDHPGTPANVNLPGPTVSLALPGDKSGRMTLKLRTPGQAGAGSEYAVLLR